MHLPTTNKLLFAIFYCQRKITLKYEYKLFGASVQHNNLYILLVSVSIVSAVKLWPHSCTSFAVDYGYNYLYTK